MGSVAEKAAAMRAQGLPEDSIRAMEKHCRDMDEAEAVRLREKRRKDILALKYPSVSTAALGQHLAATL